MKNTKSMQKKNRETKLPSASIIIAAYNNANTLKRVLGAMLCLDYPEYEIIVVDDASSDNTKEMMKSFAKENKIKYLRFEKNQGVCMARNNGIELAKNEFVVNMDHDCIPKKDWLRKIIQGFSSEKVGVVSSYAYYGGTSTAFRKSILEKVGGYDEEYRYYREDTDLSFKIMDLGYEFKLVKADFEHDHKEVMPQGIFGIIKYIMKRLKYHQNDVLLYKKHPTKLCKKFLQIKMGFIVNPYTDFSVATGLWQGKFNLSSPRGLVFFNGKNPLFIPIVILGGVIWVVLVKTSRFIGSIRYKKLLI
jgi:glycosyltransferase involved in cell wall biosynthesis